MIAKAAAIQHGHTSLRYISGESANKKHLDKITHIKDNLMQGLDAAGMWESMKLDIALRADTSRPIARSLIRIELSPERCHTEGFTAKDWETLWDEFAKEFDAVELRDRQGRVYSPHTNITGSKYTLWLHEDSRGGTPHLHADVCRVDHNGRVNSDHNIHLRAQIAARRVALRRGWQTADDRRSENLRAVTADCIDALKSLPRWSLEEYFRLLRAKGYEVRVRPDRNDAVHGYSLKKGNTVYRASQLGKGRNLTVKNISATWQKLHPAPTRVAPVKQPTPVRERPYLTYVRDYRPTDVTVGSKTHRHYLPPRIDDLLDDEFDYREYANADSLKQLALALFLGYIDSLASPSGSGGGGSGSQMPWGRDPHEDELQWLKRCASKARQIIQPVKRTGRRR